MKKITLLFLLTLLPVLSMAQVIVNGTFDSDISNWIDQNAATVTWNSTDGAAAVGSMQIVAAAATNSGAKINPNVMPSVAGDYILKFKVKGTAGDVVQGSIFQGGLTGGDNYTISASGVWEDYTTTFTAIDNSTNLNVRIIGKTASSTYLIDDVEFVQLLTEDDFVTNPDFELNPGAITSWTNTDPALTTFSATATASSGVQAARLDFIAAQTANSDNAFLENIVADFGQTVNPSEINISLDADGTSGLQIQVKFETFDASDNSIETLNTGFTALDAAGGFENISFNKIVNLPFNKIQVSLKVRGNSSAQIGDFVIFDNVLASFAYEVLSTDSFQLNNASQFGLYPNPAKNTLNFSNPNVISQVSIFDITGKQVIKSKQLTNGKLNISALTTGVYIVQIVDQNNSSTTKKLVKE
jgi:hypothetical protein